MRRIWFTFKIFEVMLGLSCLGYHARGFLSITNIQDHYAYVAVFAGFTLMAMFGCISICLKETVSPVREGCLNMFAAIAFISVSINSMYHAEKDYYLMYLTAETIETEALEELEISDQPHPFFKYSKAQSIAALCCGSLFLLHAVFALDFAITAEDESSESDEEDEYNKYAENLTYYVFTKKVHEWLNHFEWFHTMADPPAVRRRTEVLIRVNLH